MNHVVNTLCFLCRKVASCIYKGFIVKNAVKPAWMDATVYDMGNNRRSYRINIKGEMMFGKVQVFIFKTCFVVFFIFPPLQVR